LRVTSRRWKSQTLREVMHEMSGFSLTKAVHAQAGECFIDIQNEVELRGKTITNRTIWLIKDLTRR
jgi:hypothetical protein